MAESSVDARMVALAGVPDAACRINELPSDVLLRALSHLNALQVVQTSVLSRRWRDLWRSVPRIKATFLEFEGMADTEEGRDVLFKVFVNRLSMLRNPVALFKFRLQYHIANDSADAYADSEDADLWIRHALQCNARSVKVYVGMNELHLQSVVFASNCLLTRLLLSGVFLRRGFFRDLQSCTVLEHLTLCSCTIYDPEISSQTLKVLTIDGFCACTYQGHASISIPSLICLEYSAQGRVPLLNNMESLETASVSVGTDDTQLDIHQFLRSLSGVTDLEFYYDGTALMLEQDLQWCPKFNNLMTLTLGGWFLHAHFNALIVFLQNSPNLVALTLELKQQGYQNTEENFLGELEGRSFNVEHLQTVCLDGSKNDPMDLHWCPKFNNLTTLTLGGWFLHAQFNALIVFLQNSPNLVALTLVLKKYENTEETFLGELEGRSFNAERLQTVCLDGSKNDPMVNILKKFFLDNGMTSNQIDIRN